MDISYQRKNRWVIYFNFFFYQFPSSIPYLSALCSSNNNSFRYCYNVGATAVAAAAGTVLRAHIDASLSITLPLYAPVLHIPYYVLLFHALSRFQRQTQITSLIMELRLPFSFFFHAILSH